MNPDSIVEEVRAIREQLSAHFDFDIRKIVEDAQKRQATSLSRIISVPQLQHNGTAIPVSSEIQSLPLAGI